MRGRAARVPAVVHKDHAPCGDYVFAHVNFLNLLIDDPGGHRHRPVSISTGSMADGKGRRALGRAARFVGNLR